MIPFASLYSELAAFVKTTWPDIVVAGATRLWEADHLAGVPFDKIAGEDPFAVIVYPEPEEMSDLGITIRSYILHCEVYWCAQTLQGSETQRAKAEGFAATIRTSPFTNAQVWDDPVPRARWGRQLPVNMLLLEKKAGFLAGGCVFGLVVGETL